MAEYLILVGMSGAGRSTAAATFEDRGWFVIDNLPPALIGKVAELTSQAGTEYERVCLVVGTRRLRGHRRARPRRSAGCARRVHVCAWSFLDAPDEVLVRRYEGTRRRHPVEATSVLAAIQHEREMLDGTARRGRRRDRDRARLNVHRAARPPDRARRRPCGTGAMQTAVVSFGFKHGLPLDVDLVLRLPLPAQSPLGPELRALTGLDAPVRDYVLGNDETKELLGSPGRPLRSSCSRPMSREGKSYLSIAIGCTGGRHRSVVLAEEMAERIRPARLCADRPSPGHRPVSASTRPLARRPRVVAIGGGHGLAQTLRAARRYASEITAVVSVADDGGSSGRLRELLGIPAPGDLRRCIGALLPEPSPLGDALEHRFVVRRARGPRLRQLADRRLGGDDRGLRVRAWRRRRACSGPSAACSPPPRAPSC